MPPRKFADDETGTARAVPVRQARPVKVLEEPDTPAPSPVPDIVTRSAVEAIEGRVRGETDGGARPSVAGEAGEVIEGQPPIRIFDAIIEPADRNIGVIGPEIASGEDFAKMSGMQETEDSYRARGLIWAPGTGDHGERVGRGGAVPVTVAPSSPIATALPSGGVRERNEIVSEYVEPTGNRIAARPPSRSIAPANPQTSPGGLPAAVAPSDAPGDSVVGRVVMALVVTAIVAVLVYAAKKLLRAHG